MNRADQIRAAVPMLSELERLELERALHDELDERCAMVNLKPIEGCPDYFEASETSGCLFWLQNLTMTTDDHWQTKGTPAKAPFPKLDYLRPLFGAMQKLLAHPELKRDSLFVAKSRDMLVSWSVMGYVTWMAQFRPQTFWVCQSAKEDKAVELLRYARTLYHNQPSWLQERHPLEADNVLEMRFKNGSRILGVPAGEDQIRIHHPFGYFADEAAFLPNFEDCLNAVLPVVSQVVAVSTAAPSRFCDLCELDGADSNSGGEYRPTPTVPDDAPPYVGQHDTIQWPAPGRQDNAPGGDRGRGGVRHFRGGMPEVFRG